VPFVDANVFLRHLTGDDPKKAEACYALFQKAQGGEIALITSESVIAEVVYVLSSRHLYDLPRERIRALLYPILSLRGLKLPHRRTYLQALDLYADSNLDFEDALAVAQMKRKKIQEIYSYDRGFDRVAGIRRLEP